MRSTEEHARDLADAVLQATDMIIDESRADLGPHAMCVLIGLRVRARDVLESIPRMTEEEQRRQALRIERWGRLGLGRRAQDR